jgi:RNA polymerase sigma-70 factor (ECF subfamily)
MDAVSGHKSLEVHSVPAIQGQPARVASSAWARECVWRSLYDESFDTIYRLAFSLGVPAGEIEDVVQRVFLVAYRRLRELQDEVHHPRAWLRGIAVRVVCEHRRWRRVRRVKRWLLQTTVDASAEERSTTPEELAHVAEARQMVHRVLNRMSPKLRDVLVLLEIEECPVQEVATILRIPGNTVRSRKRLARAEFERLWRRHVGREEPHE